MRAEAGRIIFLSSVVGEMGNAGQTAYAASKAALLGVAKSIAREYASRNITVNAVAPGFIDTDMTTAMTDEHEGAAHRRSSRSAAPGRAGRSPPPAFTSRATRPATSPARCSASTAACTCEPLQRVARCAARLLRLCRLDSAAVFPYTRRHEAPWLSDITAEVKRIIKEQLDVDEKDIKPESTFIDDLGADSLGLVELVLAFEEAFEIDIPDEDTEKIRTVQDAVDYIEKHAKK